MDNPNASVHESWYTRIFARVYDPVMRKLEERVLSRYRRQLIGNLEGDVLEVGAGTGINFKYYTKACRVLASEPSAQMLRFARQRALDSDVQATITLIQAGVGSAELEKTVPQQGFDAIVCTLVLCTIPEPLAAIRSFKCWLKPGGKLIVLEHVHSNAQPRKTVHELINPAWKVLAEGCNLTRDTPSLLKEEGFSPLEEERFIKLLPFYVAVMQRNPS